MKIKVSDLENVWSFTCDWRANELVAQTARDDRRVVRIDLASGNSRSVWTGYLGLGFELMPDGRQVVYEDDGTILLASIDGGRSPEAIARGGVPSLSPDGSTVAFMGGEDASTCSA
ncbi:MAG: hypothetical protein KF819_40705 [Labilithrix sp.]|nr:hypothetical protein [Labilithrix sp.]